MVEDCTRSRVLRSLASQGKDPCVDPLLDDHEAEAGLNGDLLMGNSSRISSRKYLVVGRDMLEGVPELVSLVLGEHGELRVTHAVTEHDDLGRPRVVHLGSKNE